MKHLLSILTMAVIAIVAWGCSSGSEEVPVTVSPGAVTFSSNAGKQTVLVTAGSKWEAVSSQPGWCTTQCDGKQLIINVTKNYAAKERTAQITVTSGSQSAIVGVSQKKGTGKFDGFEVSTVAFEGLNPTGSSNVVFPCVEAEYAFQIKTLDPKYQWKAEVTEGADFVSVPDNNLHRGSDYLKVTVKANATVEERKAQVKIESELEGAYCTYLLNITQLSTHRNEDPFVNNEIIW